MDQEKFAEILNRHADHIITRIRNESYRPFSGIADSPAEAVDRLRKDVLEELRK